MIISLSLFLFLKCFLNYTLERLLSKVGKLGRVNSHHCDFLLPTPAKISAWRPRGRWKGSASPSPRFGVGRSCSTDSQAAGLLLRSRAGWARRCGEREMDRFLGFVKQIRRSRRRKGKKYRAEEDYHEGYEDVYYYASEHFRSKRSPLHPPPAPSGMPGLTMNLAWSFNLKCKRFSRWCSLGAVLWVLKCYILLDLLQG